MFDPPPENFFFQKTILNYQESNGKSQPCPLGDGKYVYYSWKQPQNNLVPGKTLLKPVGILRPHPRRKLPYNRLECSKRDEDVIYVIISNMAERSKLWLLLNQVEFYRMGDSIAHVHPLKFLEIIFKDAYLTNCMIEIFQDYFKRNGFMKDLGAHLAAKLDAGE